MLDAKVVRESIKEGDRIFSALYFELRNACILFLSEEEDSLGTVAVSLPPRGRRIGPSTSSVLLGDRNIIVARLLAERLANMVGKIALVSVFTRTAKERDVSPVFLKLIEKVITKREESR
mgnify:CR=1 FL=1